MVPLDGCHVTAKSKAFEIFDGVCKRLLGGGGDWTKFFFGKSGLALGRGTAICLRRVSPCTESLQRLKSMSLQALAL